MTVRHDMTRGTVTEAETQRIALSAIRPVPMREQIDEKMVARYARCMLEGAPFPPVVLFFDGEWYRLGDGQHRVSAAETIHATHIDAKVRPGGEREAIEYAALVAPKDNPKVRYTPGDLQLRVRRMWETHPEWVASGLPDREIARILDVSHDTVRRARERYQLSGACAPDKSEAPAPTPPASLPSTPQPESAPAMVAMPVFVAEAENPPAILLPVLPEPEPATESAPPARKVTVTRTSKHGKVTIYEQKIRPRVTGPEPEEPGGDEADAFAGMRVSSMVTLLGNCRRDVAQRLGTERPSRVLLEVWWAGVEQSEVDELRPLLDWMKQLQSEVRDFINHKGEHAPMTRKLRVAANQRRKKE